MRSKIFFVLLVLMNCMTCFSEKNMNVTLGSYIYSYSVNDIVETKFIQKEPEIVYVDSFPSKYTDNSTYTYGDVWKDKYGYYVYSDGVYYYYDFETKQFMANRKPNKNITVDEFKYLYRGKEVPRSFFSELANTGLYEVRFIREKEPEKTLEDYLANGKQWYSYNAELWAYADYKEDLDQSYFEHADDSYCVVVNEVSAIEEGYGGLRKYRRLYKFTCYYCCEPNEWAALAKVKIYRPEFSSLFLPETMWSFDYNTVRNYKAIE